MARQIIRAAVPIDLIVIIDTLPPYEAVALIFL
jgi:hypothetical protein